MQEGRGLRGWAGLQEGQVQEGAALVAHRSGRRVLGARLHWPDRHRAGGDAVPRERGASTRGGGAAATRRRGLEAARGRRAATARRGGTAATERSRAPASS